MRFYAVTLYRARSGVFTIISNPAAPRFDRKDFLFGQNYPPSLGRKIPLTTRSRRNLSDS